LCLRLVDRIGTPFERCGAEVDSPEFLTRAF
jgi:hypothetical protein